MSFSQFIKKRSNQIIKSIDLAAKGLYTDGELQKQWYLEQILEVLGIDFDTVKVDFKRGIKPEKEIDLDAV